jgi:hypothetical protein
MNIIVNNQKFPHEIGSRLLKLKNSECPFPELKDTWDSIKPLTFKEIARLPNLEQRRVGVVCLGLERLVNEVKPRLISRQNIEKTTNWVNEKGERVEHKFNDIYELYEVDGSYFNEGLDSGQTMRDCYYVKCKDTSTDRTYFIWVDPASVYTTNEDRWFYSLSDCPITAIQAIAWTIQTNVPKGHIKEVLRQGDCILIKPKGKYEPLTAPRHLTEKEYIELLVAES